MTRILFSFREIPLHPCVQWFFRPQRGTTEYTDEEERTEATDAERNQKDIRAICIIRG
jgi:hypothetical protein